MKLEATIKTDSSWRTVLPALALVFASGTAGAAEGDKPNILFIMGDDIGIMNVAAYHRGLMVGETSNIDRLAQNCLYRADAE